MELAPQRGFYVSAGGTGSGGDLGGWGQHRPFLSPPPAAVGELLGCWVGVWRGKEKNPKVEAAEVQESSRVGAGLRLGAPSPRGGQASSPPCPPLPRGHLKLLKNCGLVLKTRTNPCWR